MQKIKNLTFKIITNKWDSDQKPLKNFQNKFELLNNCTSN